MQQLLLLSAGAWLAVESIHGGLVYFLEKLDKITRSIDKYDGKVYNFTIVSCRKIPAMGNPAEAACCMKSA